LARLLLSSIACHCGTSSAAGGIACYTGRLLAKCMNTSRAIRTYPDIGQAAFGRWGRLLVSVLLYMELFCCCVDFLILEGARQQLQDCSAQLCTCAVVAASIVYYSATVDKAVIQLESLV
jgi:amino acid permease